jgi:nicotinate-nucleotide adenylyltransferase
MRIGVFGGSFNPIHLGHLIAAECCREQRGLDRVLFVPAATPPHKQGQSLAAPQQRLEMVALAIGGHDSFAVSALEIERGGVSYTVDTLAALAAADPAAELHLILGPDAVRHLAGWKDPARIASLARLLAVERDGIDDVAAAVRDGRLSAVVGADVAEGLVASRVRMPAIDIRASDLREAVAAGRSIRYRTPRAVERFIETHGLYRSG